MHCIACPIFPFFAFVSRCLDCPPATPPLPPPPQGLRILEYACDHTAEHAQHALGLWGVLQKEIKVWAVFLFWGAWIMGCSEVLCRTSNCTDLLAEAACCPLPADTGSDSFSPLPCLPSPPCPCTHPVPPPPALLSPPLNLYRAPPACLPGGLQGNLSTRLTARCLYGMVGAFRAAPHWLQVCTSWPFRKIGGECRWGGWG